MHKCCTDPKTRRQAARLIACLLFGAALFFKSAEAQNASPTAPPADAPLEVRPILSTDKTVTNETIQYPSGAPAHLTAVEIVLQPGQQTGWHIHRVPLFGYILEGELTVDYGPSGQRTYRQGDGFAEATNQVHNGHNRSQTPVKILAVFIGMEGVPGTSLAPPPAR
jgi:quercetin dioxygenase-like cupin family protein